MAQIYIKEVFVKYKVLVKIILNKDVRFVIIIIIIFNYAIAVPVRVHIAVLYRYICI